MCSPLRQLRTAAPCRSERRLPGRLAPRYQASAERDAQALNSGRVLIVEPGRVRGSDGLWGERARSGSLN